MNLVLQYRKCSIIPFEKRTGKVTARMHRDNVSDTPRFELFLEKHTFRFKPQDVSHHYNPPCLGGCMDHSGTMIQVRCHGFFNENLLASAKSCKHRLQVEFFGRNHIHRIDDIQLAKVSEHGTNMGNVEGFG